MLIRHTAHADIPFLPPIERSAAQAFLACPDLAGLAVGDIISEKEHRRFLDTGNSWVAVEHHEPVGFLLAEDVGDSLFIVELSVAMPSQNKGIGRQLLHYVASVARSRNRGSLTLTTFREVPWNAPFYARLGFEMEDASTLTPELWQKLQNEAGHGLKPETRCVMRMPL